MKFLLPISVVIFLSSFRLVRLQEYECRREGATCLNYKYSPISCTNFTDCAFLFICPDNFANIDGECVYDLQDPQCPEIADRVYAIKYNQDFRYNGDISYENNFSEYYFPDYYSSEPYESSGEYSTTDEYSIAEFSTTEINNYRDCRTSIQDFLSFGQHARIFELNFDRGKRELHLTTAIEVDEEYIECYRRDYLTLERVNFAYKYFANRTRQSFRRYQVDITEEPNIFFCVIKEPMVFALVSTEEVIAYSNTSSNQYISKILITKDNFPTNILHKRLDLSCQSFNVCKVIKRDGNAIFYYVRDRMTFTYIERFLKNDLKMPFHGQNILKVGYIRNVMYCESDITSNGVELNWNKTLIGTTSTPVQLCLDKDGVQVIRRCEGNFFSGAYWSAPSGNCSDTVEIPGRTDRLHKLIGATLITEVFANITAETDDFKEFTAVDVNLLSDGLKTMSLTRNVRGFEDDFLSGVNNAMRVNSSVLRNSQEQLNSTDKILDSIETFVESIAEDIKNLSVVIKSNLLTQISYPFVSDVIGLAIYSNDQSDFSTYKIISMHWEETFEDLELDKLELAMYVPTEYIRILTADVSPEEKRNFKIINTIFYNDGLFNDINNEDRSAGSRIINVNIPGYADSSHTPVYVLFRPVLNFKDPDCAFWDYGQQKRGEWSTIGGEYLGLFHTESLMRCKFNHITHFALLVLSENIIRVEEEDGVVIAINPLKEHELALTVITLIGCGLSLMGIIAILLSAIIFKGWFKKRLNSIQLAVVMLTEIIVMFVADLDTIKDGVKCVAIGATLHYIVLAKFVWMLIIARIQYLKFVKIFDSLQIKSHIIAHMLIGWILPIIPVASALLIFPEYYKSGNLNFCYAKSYALYFFLILPACIIISINIAVFVSIMLSVSRSKAKDYGIDMQRVQIRLAIMLLFMLGITWIFGIIGEFVPWNWLMLVCIYIFCILGSIQGFVLFVFNVLLDKDSVNSWRDVFKVKSKAPKAYEPSTRSDVLFTSDSEQVSVNFLNKND